MLKCLQDVTQIIIKNQSGHVYKTAGEPLAKIAESLLKSQDRSGIRVGGIRRSLQEKGSRNDARIEDIVAKSGLIIENLVEFGKASSTLVTHDFLGHSLNNMTDKELEERLKERIAMRSKMKIKTGEEAQGQVEMELNPDLSAMDLLETVDLHDRNSIEKAMFRPKTIVESNMYDIKSTANTVVHDIQGVETKSSGETEKHKEEREKFQMEEKKVGPERIRQFENSV